MATIQKFEDLEIWMQARILYQKISVVAKRIRQNHEFRFADQIKSAAGSGMDNIAEGFERNSRLEFLTSLGISKGEYGELKSQLYRCLDDKYTSEEEFSALYASTDILIKKIAKLIIYLNRTNMRGLKFKNRLSN